MARVLSGIQPSGDLHLGNYLGAIRNWVTDQGDHDAFFCVVDLHALTLDIDPAELRARTHDTALDLLAAGLDPDRCTLFVQSHVVQHSQMAWLLECTAAMGELERMTQFKDKGEGKGSVAGGAVHLPRARWPPTSSSTTPSGCRWVTTSASTSSWPGRSPSGSTTASATPWWCRRRPSRRPAPGSWTSSTPTRKMSKSVNSPLGTVLVLDDPAEITRKVKKAVTDTDGEVRYDPDHKPGVSNLLELLAVATGRKPDEVAAGYERYGDLKADTAEALVELLRPLQARRAELAADPGAVPALLARGAAKATEVAVRHLRAGGGGDRSARPGMTTAAPTGAVVTDATGPVADGDDGCRRRADGPAGSRVRWFLTWSLRPVLLYLASRAGMLLVAFATSSNTHQSLSRSLTVWDSTWYLSIARGGYVTHIPPGSGNPAQSNLGFFPLVPLLTRATHEVTRFGIPVSGLITTFVLGLAAAVAVWWMLRDLFGRDGRRPGDGPRLLLPRRPGAEPRLHRGRHHPDGGLRPHGPATGAVGGGRAVRRRGHHGRPGRRRRRRPVRGGRRAGHPGQARVAGAVGPGPRPPRGRRRSSSTCGPTPGRRSPTSTPSGPDGRAGPTSTGSRARSPTCSPTGSAIPTTPSRRSPPWWPWASW